MNFLRNLAPSVPNISTEEIIINLVLAFVLGLLVAIIYRYTNRHKAINISFIHTLIMLAMVVGLVMMVIGNSIARAFSLVGALSIIRFRTVVKDNRDIAFIFFALAAGMAAGIGNYRVALYGVGVILIIILILDFIQFGGGPKRIYLLRLQIIPTDFDEESLKNVFDRLLVTYNRLTVKTLKMGQYVEHSYSIRMKKGINEHSLISQLSSIEGMERVILVADEGEAEG